MISSSGCTSGVNHEFMRDKQQLYVYNEWLYDRSPYLPRQADLAPIESGVSGT
jgi:hypothetical protein